jgi:Flp pilus assembly protein TadB
MSILTEGSLQAAAARQRELNQLAVQPPSGGKGHELNMVAALALLVGAIVTVAVWGIWALAFGAVIGAATWLVAGRRHETRRRLELVRFLRPLEAADSLADARTRVQRTAAGSSR